jgi:small subunit ribosomal protein S4
MVNGRRVDIPSTRCARRRDLDQAGSRDRHDRSGTELVSTVPAWLQADHDSLTAKVLRSRAREISAPVQEQLIVELYSK